MSLTSPRVTPFGERAYLIELGESIDPSLNAQVHALAARLEAGTDGFVGLERPVPAYASLLVPFDPAAVDAGALGARLEDIAATIATTPVDDDGTLVEVPVAYGYDDGPDLADVAAATGLSRDAVIDLHASASYRVYMLGFAPGFAYLGPLPEPLRLPRRAEPRLRVPAGSVAIAGAQTAVYPHVTAGGWHLIGRTGLRLWDPAGSEPARLRPGDHVRFVPA